MNTHPSGSKRNLTPSKTIDTKLGMSFGYIAMLEAPNVAFPALIYTVNLLMKDLHLKC